MLTITAKSRPTTGTVYPEPIVYNNTQVTEDMPTVEQRKPPFEQLIVYR